MLRFTPIILYKNIDRTCSSEDVMAKMRQWVQASQRDSLYYTIAIAIPVTITINITIAIAITITRLYYTIVPTLPECNGFYYSIVPTLARRVVAATVRLASLGDHCHPKIKVHSSSCELLSKS